MNNTELKKNAEGYTDPTAAATLSKPGSGDIWTYEDNLCLIIKNHGPFSTMLLLVDKSSLNPSEIQLDTAYGVKWSDPRRLTYGRNYKIHRYVETISPKNMDYIVGCVNTELGIGIPCRANDFVDPDDTESMLGIVQEENKALKMEVERLTYNLDCMTDMHSKAVDRVNKVTFAKMKLENQLALLQSMIGTALAQFQVDTEA